jgi:hypothetical protein
VVRERLYRDAIELAVGSAGRLRWIPPPVNDRYDQLRLMLSNAPTPAGSAAQSRKGAD